MSEKEVFIVSAARTAIGSFGGSLASIPAPVLGSVAIRAALSRAGIGGEVVGEVSMGCALEGGLGQAPARQAAFHAGIPDSVPCTTVNKVCGSGLQTAVFSARALILGEWDTAVAGGMENMSACPYILPKARTGFRLGHAEVVDMMIKDGLWDIYNDLHMGMCADLLAKEENVSREEQDDYAVSSYRRALRSIEDGITAWEIAPVEVPQKKGNALIFDKDEGPGIFNEEKMRKLRPVFNPKDGTVTAGNASPINDGAAAVVMANEAGIKAHRLSPLARVVSWGFGATDPKRFPAASAMAAKNALKNAGLCAADIDYWEINEAFAVVPIMAARALDIDLAKVNSQGGAIAVGHPIGASGARVLVTLINTLRRNRARYGLAALCIGGGEGISMIVEAL